MWTVYEFQYQELYDFHSFTTKHEAEEYRLKRILENEEFYESDISRYVYGLNFVIE